MRFSKYNYYFIYFVYKLVIFIYRIPGIKFISNLPLLVNLKNYIKLKFFKIEFNSFSFFKKKYLKSKSISQNNKKKNIFIEVYSLRPQSYGGVYRVTSEISRRFIADLNLNKKYNIYYFIFNSLYFEFATLNIDILLNKKKIIFNKIIFPKKNDIVLLLGNDIINVSKYKKYLVFLSNQGVKFYTLIYDILPFLKPQWFEVQNYKKIFKKFILSLTFNDKILTISRKVKFDLYNNFNKYFKINNIFPIKLGSDLETKKKLNIIIKKNNKNNSINFLIVSTLEPRKGHIDIVKVFNFLFLKNNNLKLYIVGKKGWKYKNILKEIRQSAFYNKNLFYFESLNDDDLQNMYIKSDIVIVPSYDEGFGLPIIEALNYKKIVIARDIAVFKELAQNNLYYFPNKKKSKLKLFFSSFISNYQQNKIKIKKTSPTKWKNTYLQIKKICNLK